MSKRRSDERPIFSVTKDDCEWDYFRAGGNGGQNQNKRDTGVRVRHPESGAVGESREERSQLQNRKAAFKRMTETVKFKTWLSRKLMDGPTAEERVEQDMQPKNLKIEGKVDGKCQELVS